LLLKTFLFENTILYGLLATLLRATALGDGDDDEDDDKDNEDDADEDGCTDGEYLLYNPV
jgi:hypothetical protein